ncbi:Transcription factorfungi [Penicillium daleae]|uniref:Transcription factorfungi n=1 Tax=Penicillium daleae TaxID=63821 RepID=A0AAD6C5W3_9EURO|nr:Transcription factorfungi [Penicillium daleae]KAJ5450619.1 Transcription factorfungi [Penicillium daleae]
MPGILPMKVIKVGGTQSRIAQACDRCRSKKIRCDGIRPCCTQCANVGFECKTSDKLSRRAFPRGYTESLEERVRTLEAEVKDLKDLLDEKDEKIDVLSRIHSFSSPSQRASSARSPSTTGPTKSPVSDAGEGVIHVEKPSTQSGSKKSSQNPYSAFSTTLGFASAFNDSLVSQGKSASKLSIEALTKLSPPLSHGSSNQTIKTAPRLVSDQLINIFFQEWAPLYPVVHRPTILKAYGEYLNNSDSLKLDVHVMAQLNLIFGIAALSSNSRTNQDPAFFEQNWTASLDSFTNETSIGSLQCFILAQLYCMTKGDYRSMLRYRALAVDICHQLELHQSQTEPVSNPLEAETRKKVFWCQYTVDRFCSVLTGMPVLLREGDIEIEYPVDIDDENVTESGFLPTLPGESTRISSALALFGAARILNKALENMYPSKAGYDVYIAKLRSVAAQLDEWLHNLPPHLRLEFSQDKPSTNVTSSRSPLLSLVYYFIRSLIHRPAVCFAEEHLRSPSVLAMSDSAKHIIQILELLDERRLCLSVSINRRELVFFSGLGLLWQAMGLKRDSKLAKESQKLLSTVLEQLQPESSTAATEFRALASTLVSLDMDHKTVTTSKQSHEMDAPTHKPLRSPKKQLQSLKARLTHSANKNQSVAQGSQSRRNTVSNSSPPLYSQNLRSPSWTSLPPSQNDQSPAGLFSLDRGRSSLDLGSDPRHLSFMGYDHPRAVSCSTPSDATAGAITMADWEYVLSDMDRGYSNIFTGIYGGSECGEDPGPFASITAEYGRKSHDATLSIPAPLSNDLHDLSPEAWSASSGDYPLTNDHPTQSVPSYSGESMGSNEDTFTSLTDASVHPDEMGLLDPFQGLAMPGKDEIDEFSLINGWDRRLAV